MHDSLSQIYTNLCQCCGRTHVECQKQVPSQIKASAEPLENRFGALIVHGTACDDEEEGRQTPGNCPECSNTILNSCPNVEEGPHLSDDDFGDAVELIAVLQEIWEIERVVIDCWAQTGTPITVTACVTNVAMALLRELACRLWDVNENSDLEAIHRKCHMFQDLCQQGSGNDEGNGP